MFFFGALNFMFSVCVCELWGGGREREEREGEGEIDGSSFGVYFCALWRFVGPLGFLFDSVFHSQIPDFCCESSSSSSSSSSSASLQLESSSSSTSFFSPSASPFSFFSASPSQAFTSVNVDLWANHFFFIGSVLWLTAPIFAVCFL